MKTREEINEYQRKWYRAHPGYRKEQKAEYDRQWAATHRERVNARSRKWRKEHPDYWKKQSIESVRKYRAKPETRKQKTEYQRKYRAAHPEIYVALGRRWRQANNGAVKAQLRVQSAIKRGKLTRQPCRECANPKSHAHHPDYSKPLEVIWLCALHHKQEHKKCA